MEGVVESRIHNRVSMMKAFAVVWDFKGILKNASNGQYSRPKYVPLNESEMPTITETIKKYRKQGDTYQDIINKCMVDWEASLKAQRDAKPDSDKALPRVGGFNSTRRFMSESRHRPRSRTTQCSSPLWASSDNKRRSPSRSSR